MTAEQRRLATFMFTDMVGYSALAQKNDTLAADLLAEHRRALRPIFAAHHGQELDAVGDGFLVEFPSAVDAARCAVAVQQQLHDRNTGVPADRRIQIRIGLHLGDVVVRDGRAQGDGVNIAARIEPLAAAGGICLSEDVARQVQTKLELPLRKLGKGELKNIRLPVDIYRVLLPWEGRHLPFSERVAFAFRQRGTRRITAVAVTALALVAIGGSYLWPYLQQRIPAGTKPRVAVLPFANMSAEPDSEYFADGITEELISQLSRLSGLDVIARTSVMKYKGANKDIADVGRELNVGSVLEGSVRKAGNRVRVSAQLIAVENQAHLWGQDYDRELRDVLDIQTEIGQRVADALRIRLLKDEKRRANAKGTENLDAYNLYLQGHFYANKRTPDGLRKGVGYFEQAVRTDPSYALAYVGLADARALLGVWYYSPPRETFPLATAAALKALEIDETLGEAHATLAGIKLYFDWQWSDAEEEYKRAIAFSPSSARAHHSYGWMLMVTGRPGEAQAELGRALDLDPLSLIIRTHLAVLPVFVHRCDQAINPLKETLEMDASFVPAHSWLGVAYSCVGMYDEARNAYMSTKADAGTCSVFALSFKMSRLLSASRRLPE